MTPMRFHDLARTWLVAHGIDDPQSEMNLATLLACVERAAYQRSIDACEVVRPLYGLAVASCVERIRDLAEEGT